MPPRLPSIINQMFTRYIYNPVYVCEHAYICIHVCIHMGLYAQDEGIHKYMSACMRKCMTVLFRVTSLPAPQLHDREEGHGVSMRDVSDANACDVPDANADTCVP